VRLCTEFLPLSGFHLTAWRPTGLAEILVTIHHAASMLACCALNCDREPTCCAWEPLGPPKTRRQLVQPILLPLAASMPPLSLYLVSRLVAESLDTFQVDFHPQLVYTDTYNAPTLLSI